MKIFNKLNSALLTAVLTLNCGTTSMALPDVSTNNNIEQELTEVAIEDTVETELIEVNMFSDNSMQELYKKIASELNIDKKYIEIIHNLTDGEALYYVGTSDIFDNLAIKKPLVLELFNTELQTAEFIKCDNTALIRPSEYYLPDALYSVSYDIAALMGTRYNYNRGASQVYFNNLEETVKQDIIFYEALLEYTGEDIHSIELFYDAYKEMIESVYNNKDLYKNRVDTKIEFNDTYKNILKNIGIDNNTRLKYLATAMKYDYCITNNKSMENVEKTIILPYIPNYTSRENMMLAAMSLCGKVRYTWGGGHSGASNIDGINPYWNVWNNTYNSEDTEQYCIKPSGSWCSIHGYSDTACNENRLIYSLDEYKQNRESLLKLDSKYEEVLSTLDFTEGIPEHNLDGLDCSGYVSWVYNQITYKYTIDTTAMYFYNESSLIEIPLGENLLPGDIFAWIDHVVLVVGKVDKTNKVYVTIEQTPNILKFGVLYYAGANASDIEYAKQIATEANQLLGGIYTEYELPHIYCIDNVKYYEVESENIVENILEDGTIEEIIETGTKTEECAFIGRYKEKFIDEDTIIENTGTKYKDMYALDIIQHTLDRMPTSYINGIELYDGNLFNKETIATKTSL